jgi:hypothetical protein
LTDLGPRLGRGLAREQHEQPAVQRVAPGRRREGYCELVAGAGGPAAPKVAAIATAERAHKDEVGHREQGGGGGQRGEGRARATLGQPAEQPVATLLRGLAATHHADRFALRIVVARRHIFSPTCTARDIAGGYSAGRRVSA